MSQVSTPPSGRLNNAGEFAVAKLDDIINWARTVHNDNCTQALRFVVFLIGFFVADDFWFGLLCC